MADLPEYPCIKWPMCEAEASIVVVAVTPQNVSEGAHPTDAITALAMTCDEHLEDPWIEVKRIDGARTGDASR